MLMIHFSLRVLHGITVLSKDIFEAFYKLVRVLCLNSTNDIYNIICYTVLYFIDYFQVFATIDCICTVLFPVLYETMTPPPLLNIYFKLFRSQYLLLWRTFTLEMHRPRSTSHLITFNNQFWGEYSFLSSS